ncbi:MAG: DUF721 domain-containing protein [Nitrospirota bacterium]
MKRADRELLVLARDLGLASGIALARVKERWAELFPGPASLNSSPASIEDGRLLVMVSSPVWLQQMSFYRAEMLARLQPLGVRDIRLKVGRPGRMKPPPGPGAGPAVRARPSEHDLAFIEEALLGVKDQELASRIRAALGKWACRKDVAARKRRR